MRRAQGRERQAIRSGLMAAALSAVTLAAASQTAVAASDVFIKIGDIKGESTDTQHKDWVEAISWSWGLTGPTRNSPKPQQPVGPLQAACAQEFTITKHVDKASPVLFANAAVGTSIPTATVTVRKTDSTPLDYLVLNFSDVVITSVADSVASGEDSPTESVSFNFGSVTVTYTPQSAAGVPQDPVVTTVPGSCR